MRDVVARNGVFVLGIYNDGDIRSMVVLCFNSGMIVFNNFNCGNGGNWVEKIPMVGKEMSRGKFGNEPWYKDYKRLLTSGKISKEYRAMIDRMNGDNATGPGGAIF